MNRGLILILMAVGLFAGLAKGQAYSATVLYQLIGPTGYTGANAPPAPEDGSASEGETIGSATNATTHVLNPMVWNSMGVGVSLLPSLPGTNFSTVFATNGVQQVGFGEAAQTGVDFHALLWNGTAASAVDLNPTNLSGILSSGAFGTNGTQQVGYASTGSTGASPHAIIWTGTANSAVDLNPTNIPTEAPTSEAIGTDGVQQVGWGSNNTTGMTSTGQTLNHATIWTGTAASAVDLNPVGAAGIEGSEAVAVSGTQQVGYAYSGATGGSDFAYVWAGTEASAVNLGPTSLSGITNTIAVGSNGLLQVGSGSGSGTGGPNHALVWFGTAASAIDLNSLLGTLGTFTSSYASTVDSSGNIYGTATGTLNGVNGHYAVEWAPVTAAAPLSWASATGGNWATGSSWTPNAIPNSVTGTAFNTGSATPYTVNLTVSSAANSLNDADNVTIQKGGFNLTVPGAVTIAGTSGQHASLALAGAGANTFGALSINGFGQLDVTDNTVVINYGAGNPSPVGTIAGYIASGYSGATWTGAGIVSSKVASVNAAHGNSHLYGIGYADASDAAVKTDGFTPGTVVIEPAIVGDANLDGKVNYTDFQILAANFNGVGTSWDQGNFNYGAGTTYTDFQLLAANFNDSTSLDSAEFDAMNQFAKEFGESLLANADGNGFAIVPEPATGAILLIGGMGMLMRRREKKGK